MGTGRLMQLLRGVTPQETEPWSPQRQAARVLLVEGEPAVRGVLAQALREHGCVVLETDGQELPQQIHALSEGESLDLVISDVQTLDPLGLAALADLRRIDWVMPILLIASDDLVETRNQARKLRANAVFSRPLQVNDVEMVCSMVPVR